MASIINTRQLTYGAAPTFLATYDDGSTVTVNSSFQPVAGGPAGVVTQAPPSGIQPGTLPVSIQTGVDTVGTFAPPQSLPGEFPQSANLGGFTSVGSGPDGVMTPRFEGGPTLVGSGGNPPISAVAGIATTSAQSGTNPGPVPAVGSLPPTRAQAPVNTNAVAPGKANSQAKSVMVVFAIIIGLWFFMGWTFKGVV